MRFAAVSRKEAVQLLRGQEEKLRRLAELLSRPAGRVRYFRITVRGEPFDAAVEEL